MMMKLTNDGEEGGMKRSSARPEREEELFLCCFSSDFVDAICYALFSCCREGGIRYKKVEQNAEEYLKQEAQHIYHE